MKEFNFKEYVKRKLDNISDTLNLTKKAINGIEKNINYLPKCEEIELTGTLATVIRNGGSEGYVSGRYESNHLRWDSLNARWVEETPWYYHMVYTIPENAVSIKYSTAYFLYTSEYLAFVYFDKDGNYLDFEQHYGDGVNPMEFDLKVSESVAKIDVYSNYDYVDINEMVVKTEGGEEKVTTSVDTTYLYGLFTDGGMIIHYPFEYKLKNLSVEFIDKEGNVQIVDVPVEIKLDEYNKEYKSISHTVNIQGQNYNISLANYCYTFQYNRYEPTNCVAVKVSFDIMENDVKITEYCTVNNIYGTLLEVEDCINDNIIDFIDFNKIINLPRSITEQMEDDSVTLKYNQLVTLYKDISNFSLDNPDSMNHCPPSLEDISSNNSVYTDSEYSVIPQTFYNILNIRPHEGSRGVKFTISPNESVSVWVTWVTGMSSRLYDSDGNLLDEIYENRMWNGQINGSPYYKWNKNIFNITNNETEDKTYYVTFQSNSTGMYYSRVYDVKVLLTNAMNDTIKPSKDEVKNSEITLTDSKHQEVTISKGAIINLVLPTGKEYEEIHLHTKVIGTELLMYNSSISGSNTWNGYGYSSQYIPVEGGTEFSFYPGVDTANIEILQYTDTNNVRGTYISKNTTVTLNANTRYVKLNMWDNPGSIPATMVINEIEYILVATEKPLITETTVFEGSGEGEITLTFSEPCETYGVDKLEYGNIYELELIKSHGKWICRNPNNVGSTGGSTGGSTDITSEDILSMFMEMDLIQPIADENNVVFTDSDGKIFIL